MAGSSREGGSSRRGAGSSARSAGTDVSATREAARQAHQTITSDPEAEVAAERLVSGKVGLPLIDGLDVTTARSLEILLAAGEIAAMNPRKAPRRWKDPVMVALVLFGLALVGVGIGLSVLVGTIHSSAAERRGEFASLDRQIDSLSLLAGRNASHITHLERSNARLERNNAKLVNLVRRLCVLSPTDARCQSAPPCVTVCSSTSSLGDVVPVPTPQTVVSAHPSPTGSGHGPTPTGTGPAHSPQPSRSPTATPTSRLTLPTICLPPPLPCI